MYTNIISIMFCSRNSKDKTQLNQKFYRIFKKNKFMVLSVTISDNISSYKIFNVTQFI